MKTNCACKHFAINHNHPLCFNGIRFIAIKLVDVAGLVPGIMKEKVLETNFWMMQERPKY